MSDILKAMILGIVEGLTEFLPISSTGHLILVNQWVAFSEQFTNMFNVVIQLGAILAVVIIFRRKLIFWGSGVDSKQRDKIIGLWLKTIIGIIPAIIVALLFQDFLEEKLYNPFTVAVALVGWGVILIAIEGRKKTAKIKSVEDITLRTAFIIGIIQCIAVIPGTSRSAATIIGAMLLGASRVVAAEFSFFLAVPTMAAASGYYLLKSGLAMTPHEMVTLAIGFVVSFLVALVVIKGLMKYISNRDFKPFGYYRIVLGILLLIYFLAR